MKLRKLSLLALAGVAAAGFSGCAQPYDTDNYGRGVQAEPTHNFFGLVKTTTGSFAPVPETSLVNLRSADVSARRDFSGDSVSLFWGAINYTDY